MSSPSAESEWRRPGQIMKLHRRKKRDSLQNGVNLAKDVKDHALRDSVNSRSKSEKRRNPFSCPSELPLSKKQSTEVTEDVADSSSEQLDANDGKSVLLFDMLESSEKVGIQTESFTLEGKCTEISNEHLSTEGFIERSHKSENLSDTQKIGLACRHISEITLSTTSNTNQTFLFVTSSLKAENKDVKVLSRWESGEALPADWSLKQKARFMSAHAFSWCSSLRSLDEAQGINHFITQQGVDEGRREMEFQKCIMYWMHPNLPWVKLFPRYSADNNRVSQASLTTTDENVLSSLRTDWAESFTSAFHLLRANFCPYFYLCAPQFTVLFLAAKTQGETIQATVTPTTRGFREALTNEGIDFTLPLLEKQTSTTSTGETLSVDKEVDNSDHAAASIWLESIGLDKTEFPSLDPNKVKIQRECYKAIDNRPQSLVMVTGTDVQAFYNFLLNWRSCVASSGPQTGLPPTILSPEGFKGATLHSLKVKQSMIKQAGDDGSLKEGGVLELTGPILPHSLRSLCELFKSEFEFSATLNNLDTTTPFNCVSGSNLKDQIKGNSDSKQITQLRNSAIKELEYVSNQFHWMT